MQSRQGGAFEGDGGDASIDEKFMIEALDLAAKGRWIAHPNPAVGAVVVRDGRIIGRGYHRGPGTPHAEVEAIAEAGSQTRGADLYVTLEPCTHEGRTPPCVDAVCDAGFRRVIVAALDPDEKVSGKGVAFLESRGLDVVTGVLEDRAYALDPAYFHHRRSGLPYVRYKVAATLDGFTAAKDGSSKWITSEEARLDAQILRAQSDAVMVGIGTVLADDPLLTCRLEGYDGPQPLRVVFDSRGRLSGRERLFLDGGPVIVVTTSDGAKSLEETMSAAGLDPVVFSASERPGWDIAEVPAVCLLVSDRGSKKQKEGADYGVGVLSALEFLGSIQVVEVLLEGGSTLAGSFFEENMIDEIVVYVGSKVLGGRGFPILGGRGAKSIEEARAFKIEEVASLGGDVKIRAVLSDPGRS